MKKNEQTLWNMAVMIQHGLSEAHDRDGGEDLNDNLIAQLQGINETIYELEEDIETGSIDEESYHRWGKSLNQDMKMLRQIREFQDWKDNEPKINWIYA